jgi:hypothetical protein
MNSPNFFNYETRPAKFTERKMLLTVLQNICQFYNEDYQYIGFGGVSFTDFKLFHKELNIGEMFSIEGGDNLNEERVQFNAPFSCIDVMFGLSSSILKDLDLTRKTVVWLDYDNDLDDFMFEDLAILFRKLPKGSVYIMTCNRQLKDKQTGVEYEVEAFKEKFNNLVSFDLKKSSFNAQSNYLTTKQMMTNLINKTINERVGSQLKFHQLFNFLYQETGGARMFSFGGVIESDNFDLNNFNTNRFDFIREGDEPFRITLPILTSKEVVYVNERLDNVEYFNNCKIIKKKHFERYSKIYKYLPHYLDVRM